MPESHAPLVLASSSVYRRELLMRFTLPFAYDAPNIDEQQWGGEAPEPYTRRLSEEKARAVADRHAGAVIIGSDQVAVLDGTLLGKPLEHDRAVKQLLSVSGKRVEFLTGLCVLDTRSGLCTVDVVSYQVQFRTLNLTTIEHYLAKEAAYDSAGSFHSEGLGITLLASMRGEDPTALVGLPLICLAQRLRQAGYALP